MDISFIFKIIVFLYSVIIHEVSHGLMAQSMGDTTAKNAGRLTLNPIPHIDLFGSILLPAMLFLGGSPVLFGYAKPVPYNPANLNDRKWGPAKVGLAGPLANIILAVLFGLALRFLPFSLHTSILPQLLEYSVIVNLGLAIFNLIPIPPLDGHWLLLTFLPERFAKFKYFILQYGFILLLIFIFFFSHLLSPLIYFLARVIIG